VEGATRRLLEHPLAFIARVLRSFTRNQGLVMAGAVAYYALLSLIPLLILSTLALSHLVDQTELLATLGRYLEWLVPSQSRALLQDVSGFIENRIGVGIVLLTSMLFFSSLAFSILEKSMAVIFSHRTRQATRHFLASALLPYGFVLVLSLGLLGITLASITLQSMAQETVQLLGRDWSLRGLSGALLYLLGLAGEMTGLTLFYLAVPVGRTRLPHAALGAITVTIIWDVIRHGLVWYFSGLSKASVVYGSLTTAVVAL